MIFDKFPKKRPELPEAYQKIYKAHYINNREGFTKASSLSQKLERWLHRKVAKDVKNCNKTTLEIGAGTLNQLQYEPNVTVYDVVEPSLFLFENSENKNKIRTFYKDISEIEAGQVYERITSVATFEHITNLPEVVSRAVLLLAKDGNMRVSIPNEGTILWTIGSAVSGLEFKKNYNLDYKILTAHEHVNTANEIEAVLKYFFKDVKCEVFGLNKTLAFYSFYSCTKADVDKAKKYLST